MLQEIITDPGEMIGRHREKSGVSLKELAKHLGLGHQQSLIDVEKGRIPIPDAWVAIVKEKIDELSKVNGNAAA